MGFVLCMILAISGALIGGIAGALSAGYLVIFKSLAHIASMTALADWTKFFEGFIILLFTKTTIIAGAVTGGFFGSIPGLIGLAKCGEED